MQVKRRICAPWLANCCGAGIRDPGALRLLSFCFQWLTIQLLLGDPCTSVMNCLRAGITGRRCCALLLPGPTGEPWSLRSFIQHVGCQPHEGVLGRNREPIPCFSSFPFAGPRGAVIGRKTICVSSFILHLLWITKESCRDRETELSSSL